MENEKKPPCEFGSRCYRKNPKHFQNFSHPDDLTKRGSKKQSKNNQPTSKRPKLDEIVKDADTGFESLNKRQVKMKQTTLQFVKDCEFNKKKFPYTKNEQDGKKGAVEEIKNRGVRTSPRKLENKNSSTKNYMGCKKNYGEEKTVNSSKNAGHGSRKKSCLISPKRSIENKTQVVKMKTLETEKVKKRNPETNEEKNNDSNTVSSTSRLFTKNPSNNIESDFILADLRNKSVEEIIQILFLVDMPHDFYSFFEFCKSLDNSHPQKALQTCGLKLVGPFDVLSGEVNYSIDRELALCHWRFYYDPPEFQTVLASESEFHIGYWRDDPKEAPVFLASNDSKKDCIFKILSENIFGSVLHYMEEYIKSCDPFRKVQITKLQTALCDWAEKNNFSLEKTSNKINVRKKKVVTKAFHQAGIVVPVEAKTELGYRPLIETEANLKKICKLIMQADDESERESLWENLQPLINAANIANDECDFGNSLELGIDLFCMGSQLFHGTVEHLLSTAYSLLNRSEFEEIIKSHLKKRRKGNDLSVFL